MEFWKEFKNAKYHVCIYIVYNISSNFKLFTIFEIRAQTWKIWKPSLVKAGVSQSIFLNIILKAMQAQYYPAMFIIYFNSRCDPYLCIVYCNIKYYHSHGSVKRTSLLFTFEIYKVYRIL